MAEQNRITELFAGLSELALQGEFTPADLLQIVINGDPSAGGYISNGDSTEPTGGGDGTGATGGADDKALAAIGDYLDLDMVGLPTMPSVDQSEETMEALQLAQFLGEQGGPLLYENIAEIVHNQYPEVDGDVIVNTLADATKDEVAQYLANQNVLTEPGDLGDLSLLGELSSVDQLQGTTTSGDYSGLGLEGVFEGLPPGPVTVEEETVIPDNKRNYGDDYQETVVPVAPSWADETWNSETNPLPKRIREDLQFLGTGPASIAQPLSILGVPPERSLTEWYISKSGNDIYRRVVALDPFGRGNRDLDIEGGTDAAMSDQWVWIGTPSIGPAKDLRGGGLREATGFMVRFEDEGKELSLYWKGSDAYRDTLDPMTAEGVLKTISGTYGAATPYGAATLTGAALTAEDIDSTFADRGQEKAWWEMDWARRVGPDKAALPQWWDSRLHNYVNAKGLYNLSGTQEAFPTFAKRMRTAPMSQEDVEKLWDQLVGFGRRVRAEGVPRVSYDTESLGPPEAGAERSTQVGSNVENMWMSYTEPGNTKQDILAMVMSGLGGNAYTTGGRALYSRLARLYDVFEAQVAGQGMQNSGEIMFAAMVNDMGMTPKVSTEANTSRATNALLENETATLTPTPTSTPAEVLF